MMSSKDMRTHRLEIGHTLASCLPSLRAQEPLLLEYKAAADEDAAGDGEDNADDLRNGDLVCCGRLRSEVRRTLKFGPTESPVEADAEAEAAEAEADAVADDVADIVGDGDGRSSARGAALRTVGVK
jgi:hypothetical protein